MVVSWFCFSSSVAYGSYGSTVYIGEDHTLVGGEQTRTDLSQCPVFDGDGNILYYKMPLVELTDQTNFTVTTNKHVETFDLTLIPKKPLQFGYYPVTIHIGCTEPIMNVFSYAMSYVSEPIIESVDAIWGDYWFNLNVRTSMGESTGAQYSFLQGSIDGGETWSDLYPDWGRLCTINGYCDGPYYGGTTVETTLYIRELQSGYSSPNPFDRSSGSGLLLRAGYIASHGGQEYYFGPSVEVPMKTVSVTATPSSANLQPGDSILVSWNLNGYSQVGLTDWELSVGLTSPSDPENYWICSTDFVSPDETGSHTITLDEACINQLNQKIGEWYPTVVVSNYDSDTYDRYPFELVGFASPFTLPFSTFYAPVSPLEGLNLFNNQDKNPPGMCQGPKTKVGDPVDVRTGWFYDSKPLLAVQGAIPLEFSLKYSSFNPLDRGAGFGWSHDFQVSLTDRIVYRSYVQLPDGTVREEGTQEAVLTWPGGRATRYQRGYQVFQPEGTYTSTTLVGTYTSITGDPQDKLTRNWNQSWTLVDRQRNTFQFNAAGQLVSSLDRFGNQLSLTYVSGRLDRVTEPVSGRFLQFAYDGSGRLASVSSAGAGTVAFGYDGNGDLVGITDALGNTTVFTYDEAHRLLTETDPVGNTVVSNSYDIEGRVIKQTDASSNISASFSYQTPLVSYDDALGNRTGYVLSANRIQEQTDPTGLLTRHTYDAAGNRIGEIDPLGGSSSFTYDAEGYLTSRTDQLGNTTSFSYDVNHNLTRSTDALAHATIYDYDASNRLTKTTDAKGQMTVRTYNAAGQLATVTDPAGGVTTYTYTAGMLSSVKDPTNRTTTFGYDAAGRLVTITNPLAQTTTYTYDLKGKRLSETTPDGRVTRYAYDANGNLLTVTDPLNRVTSYTYDSRNNLITETNPLNQVTTHSYNAVNRRSSTTDPAGNITSYSYDGAGRLTQKQVGGLVRTMSYDSGGRLASESGTEGTVSYQYDAVGHLTKVQNGVGNATLYGYDSVGNRTSMVDPLGHTTSYSYDSLRRLNGVRDALGGNSSQGFSPLGQSAALQDAGGVTTGFAHDAAGRLTGITVDGATTGLTYDAAGRLATRTNARGQTATYSYNAAGLLTGVSDQVGTITNSYDAAGNLLSTTDPAGTFTMTYDALDRLTSYTDVYGNTIGYSYDAAGNLAQLTYPDNKVVRYTYNSSGQLETVTDWANRMTRYTYLAGRLDKIYNYNASTVYYSYDNAGRVIQIRRTSPPRTYGYTYDAAGRISSDSIPQTNTEDNPAVMTYNGNRLVSYKGQPVSHDADGNMTSGPLAGGIGSYSYDARGRLVQAGTTVYSYDAADRRVAVNDNGSITRLVVDPNAALSQTLMETDQNGTPIAWYVYGLGLVRRQNAAGDYHTYYYDLRGSTIALAGSSGAITDSYQYGTYGQLVASSGTTPNPFRYNGRDGVYTDSNGLYHMRARYYQPDAKRFVSLDPLLGSLDDVKTLNRYAYVGGDPVRFADPSGFSPIFNIAAIKRWLDYISNNSLNIVKKAESADDECNTEVDTAETNTNINAGLTNADDIRCYYEPGTYKRICD